MDKGFSLGKIIMTAKLSDNPLGDYTRPDSFEVLYYPETRNISDAEAYRRIGQMYMDGLGVEEDGPKGCRYLETAYEKGARNIRVGDYLMMGVYRQIETRKAVEYGLTRNLVLAIKWYMECLKLCKELNDSHGISLVYSHIGRAFIDEELKDYEKAYYFLSVASEQEPEALFYLARMYDRGLYVQRDHEKAEFYINQILNTSEFEGDVFYECAEEIMACWKAGVPDEIIDGIIYGMG